MELVQVATCTDPTFVHVATCTSCSLYRFLVQVATCTKYRCYIVTKIIKKTVMCFIQEVYFPRTEVIPLFSDLRAGLLKKGGGGGGQQQYTAGNQETGNQPRG